MEFTQKFRLLRKKKKLTQGELSKLLNVSSAYISQLELGIRHPSLPLINRIAQVFGVNISYLLEEPNQGLDEMLSDSHIRNMINLAKQAGEVDDLEEYLRWKALQAKGSSNTISDIELLALPEDLQIYFRTKELTDEDRQELVSLIRWWCATRNRQKPTS